MLSDAHKTPLSWRLQPPCPPCLLKIRSATITPLAPSKAIHSGSARHEVGFSFPFLLCRFSFWVATGLNSMQRLTAGH